MFRKAGIALASSVALFSTAVASTASSIHEVPLVHYTGEDFDNSKLKGKVCLAVNVASKCGRSARYKKYKTLNETYGDDLQILCFPCNQFGGSEPWIESEIVGWVYKKFGISEGSGINFMQKADVNGSNTQPAWLFFKQFHNSEVSWNFAALVVLNKNGEVVGRYSRFSDVEEKIQEELKKPML